MSTITTKDGAEFCDEDFGEGICELSSRSANGLDGVVSLAFALWYGAAAWALAPYPL